ncbi:MAG: hypothetical protein BWK80_44365 [Desulfobacteraceae bacterium IS3]|nr:MAG: hypothetical protein BWK80_44365 [Desulfobacteraceae bacterium IS3]
MKRHIICLMILVFFNTACLEKKKDDAAANAAKNRPVPIMVAKVVEKTVPAEVKAIGNAEAYSTVLLKPQIGGLITKQTIRDGQSVSKGELLFMIDPRPFEVALKEAKARLERDTALLSKAEEDMNRYGRLIEKNVISKEQNEQIQTNVRALQATIKLDEAGIERARIDLDYTGIKSPISGKVGSILVNEGNVVKANDDRTIAVINQIQPIYVTFSVPERYLPGISRVLSQGKSEVTAFIEGDETSPEKGELAAIDNAVDKTTGTIKVKGLFANTNNRLWPGQFLRVSLKLSEIKGALIVPSKAVQTGVNGEFVYVVNFSPSPDRGGVRGGVVDLRLVKAGQIIDGQTVLEKGVNADESVVTDGHVLLTPGRAVEIKESQKAG